MGAFSPTPLIDEEYNKKILDEIIQPTLDELKRRNIVYKGFLYAGLMINKEDIKSRNLPNQTSGLVITKIENDSPLKGSIELNSIILEAQKKKIRSIDDLSDVVKKVLNSDQKTILLVIYNSQNQRRYIGIKLD